MDLVHTISNASSNSVAVVADPVSEGVSTSSIQCSKKRSHRTISNIEIGDDVGVFAALPDPTSTAQEEGSEENPAEILPYDEATTARAFTNDEDDDMDDEDDIRGSNHEEDDEEEEDDYEYEDDDDAQFSGFIVNNPNLVAAAAAQLLYNASSTTEEATTSAPATIRDEDEPQQPESISFSDGAAAVVSMEVPAGATTTSSTAAAPNRANQSRWRQPSKAAVSMSLRAEQETSGGKRRLAQDLYRIMNQDTLEAGFSLAPAVEDCMKRWAIKLFQFDSDSNLAKDMLVLGLSNIELEMTFPDQYPFEPPFVRVVKPRFKRQTGFVMNGALCMELLTKDGWSPINDIESVIVSIRSLLAVGDGRLEAAVSLPEAKYDSLLKAAQEANASLKVTSDKSATTSLAAKNNDDDDDEESHPSQDHPGKRQRTDSDEALAEDDSATADNLKVLEEQRQQLLRDQGGVYSVSEAQAAYSHLSDYHKKKGWDTSGWWARKG